MKGFILLLSLGMSFSALAEDKEAKVFSAQRSVLCKSSSHKVEMKPRGPKLGEAAIVYSQNDLTFIKAKIDVTITDRKNGKVVKLVVNDNTDPWEASWPLYGSDSDVFSFYLDDEGAPYTLKYKNISLLENIKCSVKYLGVK